jgi:hypothetical protein
MKKILFLIILINTLSLYSQEKQEEQKKNHNIIVKGQIGFYSKYQIPDVDIDKKSVDVSNLIFASNRVNALGVYETNQNTISPMNLTFGLEYRFQDRFRILADQRFVDSKNNPYNEKIVSDTSLVTGGRSATFSGKYNYTETVQKYGLAYYQPILEYFKIGAILRNYKISQKTEQDLSFALGKPIQFVFPPVLLPQRNSTENISNYSGLVPGIGFEWSPTKFLEIRYSYEVVNIKGNGNASILTSVILPTALYTETSKLTYSGSIQNFDIGFKIPKINFFTMRFGYTRERLKRKITDYTFYSTDFANVNIRDYLITKSLTQSLVIANVNFDNLFVQFEFNKEF